MTTKTGKTKWIIDHSHSELEFKVKHLMITNVKGEFKEFDATIFTGGEDFMTSDIELVINPASISTGDAQRDAHLKSGDFFDVENYNRILFKGRNYEKADNDNYILNGDLTIKGITKPVKLDVEFNGVMKDPWGNEKVGYSVSGKINRSDWGLNWNTALEAGGVLVSDEIRINGDVQLVKESKQ